MTSEPPQPPALVAPNDPRWYVEWDGVRYWPSVTERNLNGAKRLYWKLYKEWERNNKKVCNLKLTERNTLTQA